MKSSGSGKWIQHINVRSPLADSGTDPRLSVAAPSLSCVLNALFMNRGAADWTQGCEHPKQCLTAEPTLLALWREPSPDLTHSRQPWTEQLCRLSSLRIHKFNWKVAHIGCADTHWPQRSGAEAGGSEFKASLVYIATSKTARVV